MLDDTPPPSPGDLVARIERLASRAARADGVEPVGEQPLLDLHAAAQARAHPPAMVRTEAGEVVAAAVWPAADPTAVEVVVDPAHRRRGLGSALVAELLARAPGTRFWAHGNLPAARGTAAAAGLVAVRELWRMSRALGPDDPDGPDLPAGYAARSFVPGRDDRSWLALNGRAFAAHPEQGRLTLDDLHERMAQPWFDPEGLILVEHQAGGALAASHWTKVESPAQGEVYVVAVDPDHQGRGLSGPLTALGLAHLRRRGVPQVTLYVEADNERAVATYRRQGFERDAVHAMYAHDPDEQRDSTPGHGGTMGA